MDLEGIMLSETSQTERQILYDFNYRWNLKKFFLKKNEYNKKEKDSQIQRTNQWLPVGRGKGSRANKGKGLRGTNYYV